MLDVPERIRVDSEVENRRRRRRRYTLERAMTSF